MKTASRIMLVLVLTMLTTPASAVGAAPLANLSTSTAIVVELTPTSGLPGSEVRIQGAGFSSASVVTFGGAVLPASSVTFVASTQLRVTVPQISGLVSVHITTGAVQTLADTFSVLTPLEGQTLFNHTVSSLPARQSAAVTGVFVDVDHDSDLDLLMSESGSPDLLTRSLRLYANDGAGRFIDETDVRMPAIRGIPVIAQGADIDGDGDQDILANTSVGYTPPVHAGSLLINDGSGHFVDEWSARVPRVECPKGMLGDVDGDGDIDLLLPCWWPADQQLFLNDGGGYFTLGGAFPQLPNGGASFVFGDVDDDGDLDAFGAWRGGMPRRADLLYINDGHGRFVDETEARLPDSDDYEGTQSLLADLDGDRDLDGIILGYAHDPEYVLVNDGAGHFTRLPQQLPSSFSTSWYEGYEPGDIDCDGDIDLVLPDPTATGNYETENIILLNRGNAQFEEPGPGMYRSLQGACRDQGGNEICVSPRLGDVNNDGKLDLFLARAGGSDSTQQSLLFRYAETWYLFFPQSKHGSR